MILAEAYSDKNMYSRLFRGFNMPEVVLRNIDGRFYLSDYTPLSEAAAYDLMESQSEEEDLVIKPAIYSGGGSGVNIFRIEGGMVVGANGIGGSATSSSAKAMPR